MYFIGFYLIKILGNVGLIYVQIWEHIGFLGIRFRYYIKSSQNPYGMDAIKDNYILKFRNLGNLSFGPTI